MNYPRFEHPGQPQMFVQPILASKPTNGAPPIFTMHWRYPRIIHGEIMTHRKKSRNARSSRAVPVKTMLNEVRTIPFVPWHWGKNQKGMQAGEECNELLRVPSFEYGPDCIYEMSREGGWLRQRDQAADMAEAYMNAGYHKQNPNRLLEPFSWIDTLITSTSWANFLHLRDHQDAEPHFQDLARLVSQALTWIRENDGFQLLEPGQWHLPYITPDDSRIVLDYLRNEVKINPTPERQIEVLKKISAARCARISYTPFDGDGSFVAEMKRFDLLINSDRLHASPTEHIATPDTQSTYRRQVKTFEGEIDRWETVKEGNDWNNPQLSGNLDAGWIQFRKTLPGEYQEDAA